MLEQLQKKLVQLPNIADDGMFNTSGFCQASTMDSCIATEFHCDAFNIFSQFSCHYFLRFFSFLQLQFMCLNELFCFSLQKLVTFLKSSAQKFSIMLAKIFIKISLIIEQLHFTVNGRSITSLRGFSCFNIFFSFLFFSQILKM